MTLPRTPESDGAAADAAAGGALDGGVGVGVVVGGGDGGGDGWALMVTAGLLAAASWLGWPPPPGSAASTSFATPGSDVFGRRAQQEALRAIRSRPLRTSASIREHPLARRSISTRRPHKRPADARRSIDEMTSLPTSTSSAARRRPRQKPRTMPLDTSLKFTVPSTKPRAGTALVRAASSAKTRSAAACGADESPQGGTLHGSER